jgi:acyl phosphate:glycerol-3-phosphate acyltransferase
MQQYSLLILGVVAAYLIGSISNSILIGRTFFGIDVREHGSGNAGATNTLRVLGTGPGVIVMLLDVFKAWIAVEIAHLFDSDMLSDNQLVVYQIFVGIAAVVGHVFPVYYNFKGGKGVACIVGVVVALYPAVFPLALGCFLLVFLLTHYVSLASITTAVLFPVFALVIYHEDAPALVILAIAIAVFIPYTHKKNIHRLFRGEELKISFKKKSKK